ncbi:MAG: bacteriorhodopsin-like [Acidimicrobiales bacterium]
MLATIDFTLSEGQFNLVFNVFSLVTAAMGAAAVGFLLVRNRVAPRHRLALTLSTLVVGIATYHYVRITDSWKEAFAFVDGRYVPTDTPFNEGYRYADWLLTVPLLLAELVIVLALAKKLQTQLLVKLVGAATLMIVLGYPGEVADTDSAAKWIFFALSMAPFLYLLYVLYTQMGEALARQSERVRQLFSMLRLTILVTWMVYPLAFLAPYLSLADGTTEVMRQVGYGLADLVAKPAFGIVLYLIARQKSVEEGYDADNEGQPAPRVTAAA